MLTKKERVLRTLRHQEVDRLPTQIKYTKAMGHKLAAHLDASVADLPDRLDNHLLRVDLSYPRHISDDGKILYDWWGVGWSTETEGYWPIVYPLAETDALEDFSWPDPNDPNLMDEAALSIASQRDCPFIIPNLGFCLFERAWSLRGFDRFLMDMILNPDWVNDLLNRITQIQSIVARRFVALGIDGGYFGDDYGAQKGMLFSPEMWRALFKPRLSQLFSIFGEAGLPVLMHSDGNIAEILADLVDIGLSALNPVQPEVLDHAWLGRTFGDRIAFYGGVSTQTTLANGTPADVSEKVSECKDTLASDSTGLLIAPSHRLTSDIPMRNVDALLASFGIRTGANREER